MDKQTRQEKFEKLGEAILRVAKTDGWMIDEEEAMYAPTKIYRIHKEPEDYADMQEKANALMGQGLADSITIHMQEYATQIILEKRLSAKTKPRQHYYRLTMPQKSAMCHISVWEGSYLSWEQGASLLIFSDNAYVQTSSRTFPASFASLKAFPKGITECICDYYAEGNLAFRDFLREEFYPSLLMNEIGGYYNRKLFMEKKFGIHLPKSAGKMPMWELYLKCCCAKYVSEQDFDKLYHEPFDYRLPESYSRCPKKSERRKMMQTYMESFMRGRNPGIDPIIISDYINMSLQTGTEIKPYDGRKKIQAAHDSLIDRIVKYKNRGVRLTIPPTPLKYLGLPDEFHRLETKRELEAEGMRQHNCVATYLNWINDGSCVIYTADISGEHMTIEIRYQNGHYFVAQCRTRFNQDPFPDTIDYVKQCVKEAEKKGLEHYRDAKRKRKSA